MTHAATAITHMAPVMAWAALRARPSPELINASPAPAKGAISSETMQSMVSESDNTGAVVTSIALRLWSDMRAHHQHQAKCFHAQAGEYKTAASSFLFEQDDG